MVSASARMLDGAFQRVAADALADAGQRLGGALAESRQQSVNSHVAVGRERLQPILVIRPAIAQEGVEHRLQVGEALVAERLSETHQRRRLHAGEVGHGRDRSERHVLRIVERKSRHLGQPLR